MKPSQIFLIVSCIILCCVILLIKERFSVLHSRPVPATATSIGSECFSAKTNSDTLSIHMVIVPYLRYNASKEAIVEREKEYKFSLQINLAHPLVQCVHLLTTNHSETYERFRDVGNSSKMLISEVKSVNKARDPWDYISDRLLGRDVMFATADIYLGRGFEKIDPATMDREKIMYAISRHVAPEHYATCNKTSKNYFFDDICSKYMGATDGFLTRLHKPLSEQFLLQLDFNQVRYGMEGRLNWLFVNVLKYCLINPCKILNIFHYHCSDLRNNVHMKALPTGRRVRVHPSNKLYCH